MATVDGGDRLEEWALEHTEGTEGGGEGGGGGKQHYYKCGCTEGYNCVEGCLPPFRYHRCAKTAQPTAMPTDSPTKSPTLFGFTYSPTLYPTSAPTPSPSRSPTKSPTFTGQTYSPSQFPTPAPTAVPTTAPTKAPTLEGQTYTPTPAPTPFTHPCASGRNNCDKENGLCWPGDSNNNNNSSSTSSQFAYVHTTTAYGHTYHCTCNAGYHFQYVPQAGGGVAGVSHEEWSSLLSDFSKPVVTPIGGSTLLVEARSGGGGGSGAGAVYEEYEDAGAYCSDAVDGQINAEVVVRSDNIELSEPSDVPRYVHYTCTGSNGASGCVCGALLPALLPCLKIT